MTDIDLSAGQTGRSTRGRTPVWRFMVNGTELNAVVIEASMQFSKNQHDFITMTCSSEEMTDTDGLLDMPVTFSFGQAPRIEQFFGYIVFVHETTANTQALQFDMVILGATRVMQGGQPRFWRDATISGAVRGTHPAEWTRVRRAAASAQVEVTGSD